MDNTLMSEIKIETLHPLHVATFRAVSATPEENAHNFLQDWYNRQGLKGKKHDFGFDTSVTKEEENAGKRGYEVWALVPEDVQPSEGVTILDYPGGLYATMTLYKPFSDPFKYIPSGWKFLHEWVVTGNQYRGANHQWMEEMILNEDGNDLKLYYPVVAA